jgi:hypothetical protein
VRREKAPHRKTNDIQEGSRYFSALFLLTGSRSPANLISTTSSSVHLLLPAAFDAGAQTSPGVGPTLIPIIR